MKVTTQLKPYQHYVDQYDKHTVESCRRQEKRLLETKEGRAMHQFYFLFECGEWYKNKKGTIEKWMEKDKEVDRFIEKCRAPEDITCLECGRICFTDFETLERDYGGNNHKILYIYECPLKHIPKRAFYNTGVEWLPKPHKCAKCGSDTSDEHVRTKKKIKTIWTCISCGELETYEIELGKNVEEKVIDENYDKDRARFCLIEEKGHEYLDMIESTKGINRIAKEIEERESKKVVYDKVATFKKLKITELEELVNKALENTGYIKFQTKELQVQREAFLPFVVYDSKENRSERASSLELNKILKDVLKETNWRLSSDGTSYRLGMLTGRFRAYESEKDLVQLIEKEAE
jgi:RNase P subunit RPR2